MKDLTYLEKYRDTQTERDYYHRRGDSGNGAFKVYINGRSFFCVASNGGGSLQPQTSHAAHLG